MATNVSPVSPDTLIGVKVSIQDSWRKFKIPLRELTPQVLPGKVRSTPAPAVRLWGLKYYHIN